MYRILLILLIVLISCKTNENNINENKSYNQKLAERYGADDYGMKKYVFAFLYCGPNRIQTEEEAAKLQKAHLENINRLADEGKLILAGPFFSDGDLRGIYIFNVETIAEAEELTNSDPAIQAGSLRMELKEWYGSAALVGINVIHKTLEKKNVAD